MKSYISPNDNRIKSAHLSRDFDAEMKQKSVVIVRKNKRYCHNESTLAVSNSTKPKLLQTIHPIHPNRASGIDKEDIGQHEFI